LVFGNVQPANTGSYQVIVSNPAGSVTSSVATITAVASTNSYSGAVLADGAVGYWRLDETNGTTAANLGSLGHAADGTYLNGVTLGLPGALAGTPASLSAGFTASSGTTVDVPFAAQLEFWANMTAATGDYESPVTSRDNNFAGWMFYGVSGTWQFWTGTGSGFNELVGPGIQLGAWTYLAATYDGATARFYVNGVQAASSTAPLMQDKKTVLRIGGGKTENTPGAYFFQGNLDEVAVYTNALALRSRDGRASPRAGRSADRNQHPALLERWHLAAKHPIARLLVRRSYQLTAEFGHDPAGRHVLPRAAVTVNPGNIQPPTPNIH
jgi:hypothetical protein